MSLQLGNFLHYSPFNASLDADYIVPAAKGFPNLPAGQDQSGTKKLAMDCEGLVYNCDGSFYISDEYGRMPQIIHCPDISLHLPLQSKWNIN